MTEFNRFIEDIMLFPEGIDLLVDFRKVKLLIFREFLTHQIASLEENIKISQR
jgi:hypothetical protein